MADRPISQATGSTPRRNSLTLAPMANSTPRSPPLNGNIQIPRSPSMGHRQSFAENLRGVPGSPRTQRQASLNQQALQELLNNPPVARNGTPELAGRDWRSVQIGEITSQEDVRFVEMETSVEEATNRLISYGAPNVVLLRENEQSRTAVGTFDYNDLNAYLLLVVGLAHPDEEHTASFNELARRGRAGKPIPLKDVKDLGRKEPLVTLPDTADLTRAVEVFGSGIHRVIVVKEGTSDVVGILTQLRLVRFFWENRNTFPALEHLYQQCLKDLNIGSKTVIAINGDRPLSDALELMNHEGVTSLPVLDNSNNVIGNISNVDVRLLTKTTSLPLLRSSCIHFISVILSERGMNDGKDSFPVFHVNPFSTLAHTVAKLVATRSHRMWVVDAPSPGSSGPPTPSATPAVFVPPPPISSLPPTQMPPYTANPSPSISASAIPGASMSGRLSGVVSLTDILNLFAKASGLTPHDPDATRRQRRRSSSASFRRSTESSRSESTEPAMRRPSVSSRGKDVRSDR
ncbi:cell separation during budding [Coniosporium apollinis]|uniref:Protein SDS23 n=1 Tax=Coniosporium apollinis TaxID=61459 RepID=A0ABQ9NVT8_9PEZI|nr:cell separation during budding [Coniosporium apollinis]